ncbi:MAG: T9SS type A sorting domain-containing protein [Candidatus Krumholzibacteriota bacterium]|nr:T9SS type A sorting domain-containing protein [Candidatus Krumholzibacteriota bacterium]
MLTIYGPGGVGSTTVPPTSTSLAESKKTPPAIQLHQNYPNPFNPSTTIAFDLPSAGDVKLRIYNVKGELVSIVLDEFSREGWHRIVWDGNCRNGSRAASGVYFYRLTACGSEQTRKIMLLS